MVLPSWAQWCHLWRMATLLAASAPPEDTSVDSDLPRVALLVHEEFDDHLDPGEVDECLRGVAARFDGATVRSFLPLLIRRYAREELQQRLRLKPSHSLG